MWPSFPGLVHAEYVQTGHTNKQKYVYLFYLIYIINTANSKIVNISGPQVNNDVPDKYTDPEVLHLTDCTKVKVKLTISWIGEPKTV